MNTFWTPLFSIFDKSNMLISMNWPASNRKRSMSWWPFKDAHLRAVYGWLSWISSWAPFYDSQDTNRNIVNTKSASPFPRGNVISDPHQTRQSKRIGNWQQAAKQRANKIRNVQNSKKSGLMSLLHVCDSVYLLKWTDLHSLAHTQHQHNSPYLPK